MMLTESGGSDSPQVPAHVEARLGVRCSSVWCFRIRRLQGCANLEHFVSPESLCCQTPKPPSMQVPKFVCFGQVRGLQGLRKCR